MASSSENYWRESTEIYGVENIIFCGTGRRRTTGNQIAAKLPSIPSRYGFTVTTVPLIGRINSWHIPLYTYLVFVLFLTTTAGRFRRQTLFPAAWDGWDDRKEKYLRSTVLSRHGIAVITIP